MSGESVIHILIGGGLIVLIIGYCKIMREYKEYKKRQENENE